MEANNPALGTRVQELRRSARLVRLRSKAPRYLVAFTAVVLSAAGIQSLATGPPTLAVPEELAARVDPAMESFARSLRPRVPELRAGAPGRYQREVPAST